MANKVRTKTTGQLMAPKKGASRKTIGETKGDFQGRSYKKAEAAADAAGSYSKTKSGKAVNKAKAATRATVMPTKNKRMPKMKY